MSSTFGLSLRRPPALRPLCGVGIVAGLMWVAGCGGGEPEPAPMPVEPGASPEAPDATEDGPTDEADASSGETGDLAGAVTYDGPMPDLPLLVSKGEEVKNAEICSAHDIPDESLQVSSGGGLANVFIYLAQAPPGATTDAPTEPVEFDQKGCQFLPHALVVQTGQTVLVKSGDPVAHNVHTRPARNQEFNQTIPNEEREGLPLTYQYAELVPVAVKCDIHPWMSAYHLVVDHPFAAATDAEGRFEITGMPAGKHKLRVWHERAKFLEREYEVEIKPGETTEVSLSFPAEKFQ